MDNVNGMFPGINIPFYIHEHTDLGTQYPIWVLHRFAKGGYCLHSITDFHYYDASES